MSKSLRWVMLGVVTIVCGAVWATNREWVPDGRYRVDSIACLGTAYYELRHGEFRLIVPLGANLGDGVQTNLEGRFHRESDRWVFDPDRGQRMLLRATPFYLRISELDGSREERFPRFFWWSRF